MIIFSKREKIIQNIVHYKEGKIHLESVLKKQGEIISKWGFKKRLHRIMAFETEAFRTYRIPVSVSCLEQQGQGLRGRKIWCVIKNTKKSNFAVA